MDKDEKFDRRGKELTKRRVFNEAVTKINPLTGQASTSRGDITSEYKPITLDGERIWGLVENLINPESFYLKEFTVADNPKLITGYVEKVIESYAALPLLKKLQIGVMGSAADLNYEKNLEKIAEEVGSEIAKKNGILFFGAEKDYDSLSTAACRGAKNNNGMTVGVTYGKGKNIYEKSADVIISTGVDRGGPRESILALSCDAIIAISGGSGTLTEMVIGYQANIPLVAIEGTGGWADKLANQYFDERERTLVYGAKNAQEAVSLAFEKANEMREI